MKSTEMFASKDKDKCRIRDGMEVCYWNFYPHPRAVKFAGGKEIIKVEVREMKKGEESPYYGYYSNEKDDFNYVYPSEMQTRMCAPDHFYEREKRGEGKVMNVTVVEIEEVTV